MLKTTILHKKKLFICILGLLLSLNWNFLLGEDAMKKFALFLTVSFFVAFRLDGMNHFIVESDSSHSDEFECVQEENYPRELKDIDFKYLWKKRDRKKDGILSLVMEIEEIKKDVQREECTIVILNRVIYWLKKWDDEENDDLEKEYYQKAITNLEMSLKIEPLLETLLNLATPYFWDIDVS